MAYIGKPQFNFNTLESQEYGVEGMKWGEHKSVQRAEELVEDHMRGESDKDKREATIALAKGFDSFEGPTLGSAEQEALDVYVLGSDPNPDREDANPDLVAAIENGRVLKPVTVYRAEGGKGGYIQSFSLRKEATEAMAKGTKLVKLDLQPGDSGVLFIPNYNTDYVEEVEVLVLKRNK